MTGAVSNPDGGRPPAADEGAEAPGAGSPFHGFGGSRRPPAEPPRVPAGPTVAVSRQAGARGSSIARRVGRQLGWQVYDQDLLESLAQEGPLRDNLLAEAPESVLRWADDRLERLHSEEGLSREPEVVRLARLVLILGAQGEVILVGRGAGYLLPVATTLHVRVVAPLPDRVAYLSQWLRLTREEAVEQAQQRDRQRREFLDAHFHRLPDDVDRYDLLINSSLLGEELSADLIAQAVRGKWEGRGRLEPTA
jgi:cytidylate kinase